MNKHHPASISALERQLQNLRVDQKRGQHVLRSTLAILPTQERSKSGSKNSIWFMKVPAVAASFAVVAILVVGGRWLLTHPGSQSSSTLNQSQVQANGSIQNAANAQIQDAQDESAVANDDSAQISTASARLQSIKTIGDSVNESQF